MNNTVKLERPSDNPGIAVIVIDNPPVNAIGQDVFTGLLSAFDQLGQDPALKAVVITAAGRTFIAGADIKLLEQAGRGEGGRLYLHPLLERIENFSKPVIVVLHGTALGGGMELAMSAHYRVAAPDAQMGQPEVNLGIIPGAEGTQRLPRLVGIAAAVDMCVSGKPIKAPEALRIGLIDRIIEGDLRSGAIAFAREMAARPSHTRTRDRVDKLGSPEANAPLYAAGREQAAKIRRNMKAPIAVIEAIEAAATLPWEQGLAKEKEIADRCLASDESRALIHAFFAERGVSKIPDIPKDTPVLEIRKAAIVGAGTMGGGIAMALVNAGIPVILRDTDQAALDRGMAAIRKNYDASIKRGRFTPEIVEQRIAQIHPQLTWDGFQDADLILEAVFENTALKKQVFAELDRLAKPACVLASNTSTLDVDEIASATSRPERVIGLHFFSPANVMRLVEIVRGARTGKEIVATALALAKKLGKVGVVVGNCWGFVGNRMMIPYMREAQFLVEEGTTPAAVDKALYDFGMAMGIFAVDDMGGIDVMWRVRQERKHLERLGVRKPLMTDKLYEMGRLGQKTSAGWYRYDENRKAIPDPEVEALIRKTAQEAGIPQRTLTTDEILERCLYIMVNEGARILQEGYALRAADIDTIYLTGYGFPGYRGGPMWYADTVGLKKILDRIMAFHRTHADFWEPAPLLRQLAESGRTFASWDAEQEKRFATP
jgi:3-hydroxyacyl-CoA dehydrogenase